MLFRSVDLNNPDDSRTVDSQVLNDVRFTYFFENVSTTFGVNNLFDKDPSFANTGFNDNTDPRTYETTGRHIFVNVGIKF